MILADGNRYSGEFSQGLVHGKGLVVEPDGTQYEGMFDSGKRVGVFIVKDSEGKEINRITY